MGEEQDDNGHSTPLNSSIHPRPKTSMKDLLRIAFHAHSHRLRPSGDRDFAPPQPQSAGIPCPYRAVTHTIWQEVHQSRRNRSYISGLRRASLGKVAQCIYIVRQKEGCFQPSFPSHQCGLGTHVLLVTGHNTDACRMYQDRRSRYRAECAGAPEETSRGRR